MATQEYHLAHKKETSEYNKKWYQKNREKRMAQTNLWRKNNPEKAKSYRTPEKTKTYMLEVRHGITLDQFNQMFISQNGRCGICSRPFKDNKDTCVDHDHSTGRIRELLCFNCNTTLGKFEDSTTLVESVLTYLRKWE